LNQANLRSFRDAALTDGGRKPILGASVDGLRNADVSRRNAMLPVYGDSYRPSSDWSKKLEMKKKEWLARQPLAKTVAADLEAESATDWVFGLLRLERAEPTRDQVGAWITSDAPSDEALAHEARRLFAAATELRRRASVKPPGEPDHLTEADLRAVYEAVCGPVAAASLYRSDAGTPQVETHQPASPPALPLLVAHTLDWFTTDSFAELHPVEQAGLFHLRMLDLQPFARHTNRIVRLLTSFYTLRAGLPPLIFRPEDEPTYRDSVGYAFQMITQPSVEAFAFLLLRTFDRWNAVAERR
jgi:hypothetical protein